MASRTPNERHRSIPLKGCDDAQPRAYFATIGTHQPAHLFGQVVKGEMVINECGKIVQVC